MDNTTTGNGTHPALNESSGSNNTFLETDNSTVSNNTTGNSTNNNTTNNNGTAGEEHTYNSGGLSGLFLVAAFAVLGLGLGYLINFLVKRKQEKEGLRDNLIPADHSINP